MFLLTSVSGATATLVRSNDDDPRALFARALALATDVVATVGLDQLDDPTPCRDFDVRQLLEHLVDVVERVGEIGRGGDLSTRPAVVRYVHDQEWLPAFCDAAAEAIDAWADDAVLDRVVELPWSARPGRATLAMYLNEVTVHTWDLARATGQHPAWDDDVVGMALDAVRVLTDGRTAHGLRRRRHHDRRRLGPLRRTLRWTPRRTGRTLRRSVRARRRRAPHRPPGGLERAPALTGWNRPGNRRRRQRRTPHEAAPPRARRPACRAAPRRMWRLGRRHVDPRHHGRGHRAPHRPRRCGPPADRRRRLRAGGAGLRQRPLRHDLRRRHGDHPGRHDHDLPRAPRRAALPADDDRGRPPAGPRRGRRRRSAGHPAVLRVGGRRSHGRPAHHRARDQRGRRCSGPTRPMPSARRPTPPSASACSTSSPASAT